MSDYLKNMAPQYWEMTPWGLQFNQMRFAEAIIEQCAELVDNAWDPTGEQLKRHFGMAPPMGYNEEELDQDNPYNQWMNHAQ